VEDRELDGAALLRTKAAGLRAILLLNGLGISGTKKQRVDRLLLHWDLLAQYGGKAIDELCQLKGKELDRVLKQLGAGSYGNKRSKAISTLKAFLRRKSEGDGKLASMNYRRLLHGIKPVFQLRLELGAK
jgi:hypothetical protein